MMNCRVGTSVAGFGLARSAVLAMAAALVLSTGVSSASDAALQYKGADRTAKLIEGAKTEGAVVLYSAMIINQAQRPLANAFMAKYPFIKMTYWRGDTEDVVAKLSAEVRAKNLVADVVEGTSVGELAARAGLATPFLTPMIEEIPERYRDSRHLWAPTRLSYFSIAYNTKQVAPQDVPKTYDDLLNPKWKGKIAWRVGTASGTPLFITNLRTSLGEEKALEYLRKLKTQNIVNFGSGSARTLVDRVIAGEYAIALNIFAHHPKISSAKGAPVDSRLMNPVPVTASTLVVAPGLKHPHAAMLLIDFILSKEGQEILAKAEYFPVREDVQPLDSLKTVVPKLAGFRENFIGPEIMLKLGDRSDAIVQEIFR